MRFRSAVARARGPRPSRRPRRPDFAPRILVPEGPPWWHYANPLAVAAVCWRQRGLIGRLAWRDVRGRYQGSHLGLVWSLLTPALMLAVYTFVFRDVFKARWDAGGETGLEFALILFCGIQLFALFAEPVGRSPGLVVGQPNLVKKVVFPLEVLPVAAVLASLVYVACGLLLVAVLHHLLVGAVGWHVLWLPLIVVPYLALAIGVSWFLSAVGTFFRDLGPPVAIGTQLLMFVTPIFYPLENVPERWRPVVQLSPLAAFVENSRRILLWEQSPDFWSLGCAALVSVVVMQAGYVCFMTMKRHFADVV